MKNLFFSLIIIIALALAGGVWYINNNKEQFVEVVAKTVKEKTGQPLILENIPSISIFPLGLSLEGVSWGTKDAPLFIHINDLTVSIRFMDIIKGVMQADSVNITKLTLQINDNGHKDSSKASKGSSPKQAQDASMSLQEFIAAHATTISELPVRKVIIDNGHITMLSKGKDVLEIKDLALDFNKEAGTPQTIENINVTWPKIDLDIEAKSIKYYAIQTEALTASLQGENGQYTLNPCILKLYGGTSTNKISIDLRNTPTIALESLTDVIDLALMPITLTGTPMQGILTKAVQLNTRGEDDKSLRQNMEGQVSLTGNNISLVIHNPMIPLPKIAFPTAKGTIRIKNGIGTFVDTELTGKNMAADVTGSINLPQDSLDILITLQLPELELPFSIKGHYSSLRYGFGSPEFLQDLQQMLRQKSSESSREDIKEGLKRLDGLFKKF